MLIKTDLERLFKQETGFKKELEPEMFQDWAEEALLAFLNEEIIIVDDPFSKGTPEDAKNTKEWVDMTIAIRKSTNKNSK